MKTDSIRSKFLATLGLLSLVTGTAAQAETIYGITDAVTPVLVSFDSASPATVTTIGATTGTTNLRAVDFRPSNGQLYGAGYVSATGTFQLYTISLATGAASAVGAAFVLPNFQNSTRLSIDVNPQADALRVITGNGNSYRINLNTGVLIAQDTTFSGGPTGAIFADVAYTNNVPGATSTSLYTYEYINDAIGLVNPPNAGTYTQVGTGTGVTSNDAGIGFDISGATGTAYLNVDPAAITGTIDYLYSVNLTTGVSTQIGSTGINLLDISVVAVPEPSTYALLAIGVVVGGLALRRRAAAKA